MSSTYQKKLLSKLCIFVYYTNKNNINIKDCIRVKTHFIDKFKLIFMIWPHVKDQLKNYLCRFLIREFLSKHFDEGEHDP